MTYCKKSVMSVAIAAALLPVLASAADSKGPTLGDIFKNTGVTVNGYVDASYT